MKKIAALALGLIFINANAYAKDIYVSFAGGFRRMKTKVYANSMSIPDTRDSTSPLNAEAALGWHLNEFFRSEIALNFTRSSTKEIDIVNAPFKVKSTSYGGMLNFYADWKIWNIFIPNIMIGLGVQNNEAKIKGEPFTTTFSKAKASKTAFAWQLGVGVDIPLSESFKGMIGYRFRDYGFKNKIDFNIPNNTLHINNDKYHLILFGVKYRF
ncbi:tia invasion determinant-related protein [Reticulomyxa filosa]|uniref:Tia invasion determinant-related protein n=1 Tax=Reticulomyxa filosa TaxID=46433 RepID=X6P9S3_RETFI|nr:tia invasion determinant-related protein [Reticulomyxa filosa]|eukprot:ETO34916.1 tia invasion determinant-related protein [Reticulomyxa filosa]